MDPLCELERDILMLLDEVAFLTDADMEGKGESEDEGVMAKLMKSVSTLGNGSPSGASYTPEFASSPSAATAVARASSRGRLPRTLAARKFEVLARVRASVKTHMDALDGVPPVPQRSPSQGSISSWGSDTHPPSEEPNVAVAEPGDKPVGLFKPEPPLSRSRAGSPEPSMNPRTIKLKLAKPAPKRSRSREPAGVSELRPTPPRSESKDSRGRTRPVLLGHLPPIPPAKPNGQSADDKAGAPPADEAAEDQPSPPSSPPQSAPQSGPQSGSPDEPRIVGSAAAMVALTPSPPSRPPSSAMSTLMANRTRSLRMPDKFPASSGASPLNMFGKRFTRMPGGRDPSSGTDSANEDQGKPLRVALARARAREVFGQIQATPDGTVTSAQAANAVRILISESLANDETHKSKIVSSTVTAVDPWLNYSKMPIVAAAKRKTLNLNTAGPEDQDEDKRVRKLVRSLPDEDAVDCTTFVDLYEKHVLNSVEMVAMTQRRYSLGSMASDEELASEEPGAIVVESWMEGVHLVGNDRKYLFNPRHPLRQRWTALVSILLLFVVLLLPCTLGFEDVAEFFEITSYVVDGVFMMDILVTFNTGHEEGDVVNMNRRASNWAYFKGWFWIDLFTSVPIDSITEQALGGGSSSSSENSLEVGRAAKATKSVRLIRLTRLAKVLRIARLAKVAGPMLKQVFGEGRFWKTLFKILTPLCYIVFVAHYLTGFNFMMANLYNWPAESWMVKSDLEDRGFNQQYPYGFIKAMFLLVGEPTGLVESACNDGTDDNQFPSEWCTAEAWFDLATMVLGALFYSVLFGIIGNVIVVFFKDRFVEKHNAMNAFMDARQIPEELQNRVDTYFEMSFGSGDHYFREDEVLEGMPTNVARELSRYSEQKVISASPLLRDAPHSFCRHIASFMTPEVASAGEMICVEEQVGTTVYFIETGLVYVISKYSRARELTMTPRFIEYMSMSTRTKLLAHLESETAEHLPRSNLVAAIGAGCMFGEVTALFGGMRTASCVARQPTQMLEVDSHELRKVLASFPEIQQMVNQVAKRRVRRVQARDPRVSMDAAERGTLLDEVDLLDGETRAMLKTGVFHTIENVRGAANSGADGSVPGLRFVVPEVEAPGTTRRRRRQRACKRRPSQTEMPDKLGQGVEEGKDAANKEDAPSTQLIELPRDV